MDNLDGLGSIVGVITFSAMVAIAAVYLIVAARRRADANRKIDEIHAALQHQGNQEDRREGGA